MVQRFDKNCQKGRTFSELNVVRLSVSCATSATSERPVALSVVMSWFTENPWPLIVLLGIAAGIMTAVWSSQKRALWLLGALAAVLAAVALFFVERSIVTEGERVEKAIIELVAAFVREDKDVVLSYFSVQAPELRDTALRGMELVDFPHGIDVKDVSVRLSNENSRAVSRFRANGLAAASIAGMSAQQQFATRWEVTWQKEGNDWKIIEVERLHTLKEERIPILDHRPQ